LLIGFMLLLAVLSEASGELNTPGVGSALYMVGVIAVAAFLIYSGRRRRWAIENGKGTRRAPNHLGPRSASSFLRSHLRTILGSLTDRPVSSQTRQQ
jgi:hypothetical protein